jgi:hypothetical protein
MDERTPKGRFSLAALCRRFLQQQQRLQLELYKILGNSLDKKWRSQAMGLL